MSKRFGRNQRRRAREALAAEQARVQGLEQARVRDSMRLADQDQELEALHARMDTICRLIGHQAVIAGEPTNLPGGFDGMRFAPTPKRFASHEIGASCALETVTHEVLRLLEIDAIHDHFARHLHFRVQLANGRAAYGITENALREMPVEAVERYLAPQIAKELASVLAKDIKGLGK